MIIHRCIVVEVLIIPVTCMCASWDCESVFYMQNAAAGTCTADDNHVHWRVWMHTVHTVAQSGGIPIYMHLHLSSAVEFCFNIILKWVSHTLFLCLLHNTQPHYQSSQLWRGYFKCTVRCCDGFSFSPEPRMQQTQLHNSPPDILHINETDHHTD